MQLLILIMDLTKFLAHDTTMEIPIANAIYLNENFIFINNNFLIIIN